MQLLSLLLALQTTPTIRHYTTNGNILQGKRESVITLTRTIDSAGNLSLTDSADWGDDSYWLTEQRITKDGSFLFWKREDRNPKPKDTWIAEIKEGKIESKMTLKDRVSVNLIKKFDQPLLEMGDPSLYWFTSVTPKVGESVTGALITPNFTRGVDFYDLKVTYVGQVDFELYGKILKVHKITRTAEPRNETWYLDQEGMPVQKLFWTKSEKSPHRIDTVQK